jgi:hypothetical protein
MPKAGNTKKEEWMMFGENLLENQLSLEIFRRFETFEACGDLLLLSTVLHARQAAAFPEQCCPM